MKVTVDETDPPIIVERLEQLDKVIARAVARAKRQGIIGIILLNNDNADELGFAVGSDETALSFDYGHGNPPYYVSKGKLDVEEPVFTSFLLFQHHTDFSRKWVIPFDAGVLACHEFYDTGNLPTCIEWMEV